MKKTTAQIIIFAVAVLILLNVTLIGLLWTGKNKTGIRGPRPVEEIDTFIIEELEFNEEQAAAFIELSRIHREAQHQNQERFRKQKFELNQRMLAGDSFDFDSAATELAKVTIRKEREFYRFFVDVFEICDEDQKEKLQRVFFEATGPPEHGRMPFQDGPRDQRRPR